MRPDELQHYLDQRPFQPFRIHLSPGAFFDIRNPESVDVGRSTLVLALPLEGEMQRFVVVALVHIVWFEVLVPVP
jgi:hypothetical protein